MSECYKDRYARFYEDFETLCREKEDLWGANRKLRTAVELVRDEMRNMCKSPTKWSECEQYYEPKLTAALSASPAPVQEVPRLCVECGKYPAEDAHSICEFCLGISPPPVGIAAPPAPEPPTTEQQAAWWLDKHIFLPQGSALRLLGAAIAGKHNAEVCAWLDAQVQEPDNARPEENE